MIQDQFLGGVQLVSIQFSFSLTGCITKAKEPNLSYYIPIAGREVMNLYLSSKALARNETQTASSGIWISNDHNRYAKRAFEQKTLQTRL